MQLQFQAVRAWRQRVEASAQSLARRFGFEIRRVDTFGVQPISDFVRMRGVAPESPVIFDVGANVGQTVRKILDLVPRPTIHCFEPSPATFHQLDRAYHDVPGVRLNRLALGSKEGERKLFEHDSSVMSSFLELGDYGWGAMRGSIDVSVSTVDSYCRTEQISTIDLLKIDTQGSECEVLSGAADMLSHNNVDFILIEVNFRSIYKGAPSLCDVLDALGDQRYEVVSLYGLRHAHDRADWADVLFRHESR